MKDFITYVDLFGHPVQLNFDKNEYKRKTMLGGICSIMILVFMALYLTHSTRKISDWDYNTTQSI